MASQSDTLNLAASVVDNFSRPLADLTRQLKAFSSVQDTTHQRGKRVVDEHWKSYRELAKQSKDTAEHVKRLLQPAIEGLGAASVSALGSLAGVTAAVKNFGESSRNLTFLRTETGLTINQLRVLESLGPRIGLSSDQMDASVRGFSQNMDQFRKRHGAFVEALRGGASPELQRFSRELNGVKNNFDALMLVQKEIQSGAVSDVEKGMLAQAFGLPPEFARTTREELDHASKFTVQFTDEQIKAGKDAADSWDDLKDSLKGVADTIGNDLSPAFAKINEEIAEFAKAHPYIAAISASFASIAASIGVIASAGAILRGTLVIGGAAVGADAAAGGGILGTLGAGALGLLGLPLAGASAGLLASDTGLNVGEDEASRQRKYGVARGGLPPSLSAHLGEGPALDLGDRIRAGKDLKDGTKQGVFEGVLQAFQQWWGGTNAGGGAGGGTGDGGPGHGRRGLMERHLSPEGTEYGPQLPGHVARHGAEGGGHSSASLRANQAEAYKAAIAAGYSPDAAKAIVADLSGESLANPADVHADPSRSNPGQKAHGIASWDDARSAAIKAKFGKAPQDMPIGEQIQALKWEIDTNPRFAATKAALAGGGTPEGMLGAIVPNFESPANSAGEIAKRSNILHGLGDLTAAPSGKPGEPPPPPGGGYGGEAGLGQPGTAHGQKMVEVSDNFGHKFVTNEKYAAKFLPFLNKLQESGYKIHSLGGYEDRENVNAPGKLSKHGLGMAIDINADENPNQRTLKTDMPKGIAEMAAKYGLVWGGGFKGLKDPMHFEIGGGMPSHTDAPWKGLDRGAREHESMNHRVKGEATMKIQLAGFPKGTTHNVKMAGDLFKEVKLNRGRAYSVDA